MGFRKSTKLFRITFADSEYEGFEAYATSLKLGEMLAITSVASNLKSQTFSDIDTETQFKVFGQALVSWNLEEEDGTPIPATYESLKDQDVDFVLKLIGGWFRAITSTDSPLNENSSDGATSEDLLRLMDASSQNL